MSKQKTDDPPDIASSGAGAPGRLERESLECLAELYRLQKDRGYAKCQDIARSKKLSRTAVWRRFRRLQELGLIEMDENYVAKLTPAGLARGETCLRHLEAARILLERLIGADPARASAEAASLLHNLSPDSLERMIEFLLGLQKPGEKRECLSCVLAPATGECCVFMNPDCRLWMQAGCGPSKPSS